MSETNELQVTSKVNIIEEEGFQQALHKAYQEAANTGGTAYPVVMFRQGNRISFSGVLPMKRVESFLDLSKSARKGDSVDKIRAVSNRPHFPEHIAAIANYIKENPKDYIIPGLTINVQAPINVYTAQASATIRSAWMVVADTAPASPTDGQHRSLGIIKALNEMDQETRAQFLQDGVAFMLTCESNMERAHQDFADCSKTKQISPAMLTVYDLRNPANGLVIKLVEACPVFKDKVDSTSKTIGSNSASIFTTNQVRQMVKALLTGDFALADASFVERAKNLLTTDERFDKALGDFEEFIKYMTDHMEVWKEVSEVPPGHQQAKLKDIRSRGYVCLTASGLNIIGRIGHDLLVNHKSNWKEYAKRLAQLDWQKSNPLWADIVQPKTDKFGNVVTEDVTIDGRTEKRPKMQLVTNRAPLNRAILKASAVIGLGVSGINEPVDEAVETTA